MTDALLLLLMHYYCIIRRLDEFGICNNDASTRRDATQRNSLVASRWRCEFGFGI